MANPYLALLQQGLGKPQAPAPAGNSLFMGAPPAQPTMPKPQAALGALGQALATAQKQRQQASLAGSALAHKSHPQTLPGAQPQSPATPAPVAQNATTQGPPQPPSAAFGSQIDALQKQQASNLSNQQSAVEAYKAAMAAPSPDAPQYQPTQMQQANPGLALGAALAALIAPKVSQGAIGALGVDQTNREADYKRADEAAQNKYKAENDQFTNLTDKRQKNIDNQEKLASLDDRLVTSGNSQIDTLTSRQIAAQEAEARQNETIRNHNLLQHQREVRQKDFLATYAQKSQFHNDVINEFGQRMGLDQQRVDIARGGLVLQQNKLQQDLTKFNVSQDNINRLTSLRIGASLLMQTDRDQQHENSDAIRVAQQGMHDMNGMITQLATHGQGAQAAAAAQALAAYVNGPKGQRLNAALQQFGVSGDLAGELMDAESGIDQSVNSIDPNAAATPANGATAAPGAVPAAPATVDALPPITAQPGHMTAAQMMAQLQGGQGMTSGPEHAGAGGQIVPPKQAPHADPVVQQFHDDLPHALDLWTKALAKHGGDPKKAWPVIEAGLQGSDPKEISMMRRELFNRAKGSQNSGKAGPPAMQRRQPTSLNQALTQAGVSQALIPE